MSEVPGWSAFALLAAGLGPLVVYLITLHPGLPAGDSGELITVAATGGVAHPPGYPLYVMLAGTWARLLPLGSVAWRLNLFSAICMAAAGVMLGAAVLRAGGSRAGAVLSAWVFALSAPAWKYALVAEVFSLNALLAACTLLALAGLGTRAKALQPSVRPPVSAAALTRADAATIALALLSALTLAHHHTLLLLAVPSFLVTAILAWHGATPGLRTRTALAVALAVLLGLTPLLWLPFPARRADALVWGETASLRGFFSLITRAEYGSLSLAPVQSGLHADRSNLLLYLQSVPRDFGVMPLALALIGAAVAWSRRRAVASALLLYALLQVWFFTRAGFPSDVGWLRGVIERFHILPNLVLAFLAGLGAAWALERVAAHRLMRVGLAFGLLAVALVGPLAAHLPTVDQRGNRFAETLGRGILAGAPPRAVLFVQGDLLHNALAYLTRVERLRPDVVVLDQELMTYPWYVRRARALHPDVLPPLGRAQHVALRDGRVLEGLAIPRLDGTVDVLSGDAQVTLAASDVAGAVDAAPESLFRATRADFRSTWPLETGEDRYSGLPGTRNLLWLDHLAGRRPVLLLGARDESYKLRWELTPVGFAALVHPRGAPPGVAAQAEVAAAVLAQVSLEPYFRAYDPTSFESAECWRFPRFAARAALLFCQREAALVVRAHPLAHQRLLDFARRFEALDPTPDPTCLRAVGFLRMSDASFRDLAWARRDLERYVATGGEAGADDEVRTLLARLRAPAR